MMDVNKSKTHGHLAHLPAFSNTPLVFLSVTTWRRHHALANKTAHAILHDLWGKSAANDGWHVGDYMIMPDHVHLFARSSRLAVSLGEWVKMWKSVSSRRIKNELNLDHQIWQADYFDRYVRSSESYSDKWRYVEQNPVRKEFVKNSDDWKFKGRIFDLSC